MVTIGCDVKSSIRALDLAKTHQHIFASVGIHPHDAAQAQPEDDAQLSQLSQHSKCVAIGECGLDYYYDNSPRVEQQNVFRRQIRIAHAENLPLVMHVRDAWDDFFTILDDEGVPKRGGVVHCFTGSKQQADESLKRGLHLSIPGVLTFKNPGDLPEVVKEIPVDRFFVETDSPFLAPIPHRGKRNEPSFVVEVAKRIAELRGVSYDALLESTTANAKAFFHI
jgi:TatD DNase family protein